VRLPVIIALPAILLLAAAVQDTSRDIVRGFDILGAVYKNVLSEYVGDVSAADLFHAGVNGMLKSLDPYAELIEQRENSDVDALSRGSYGGLGIKVRTSAGVHYVSDIYPEVRSLTTLRIGDELLAVDGHDIEKEKISDLRTFLRGAPGSNVQLVVRRAGVSDSLALVVQRRRIKLNPVPYHAVLEDGMFYLKLSRFTRSSADSVRNILRRVLADGEVRGVILDVRDNSGGLLEAAVALVDQFVSPGTSIVSMRGRHATYSRDYPARETALDEDIPVAVLVNNRSASASEIVAGAFQDLDRAIIVGERTFGKGLVQTLVPLPHGTTLKLTTSRYYLPSGRCIQRFVYENGQAQDAGPQSNTDTYSTLVLNRNMKESIGITPDVLIARDSLPAGLRCLSDNDGIFRFVTLWNNQHRLKQLPLIDDKMQIRFHHFYDSLASIHGGPLTKAFQDFKSVAEGFTLNSATEQELEELENALQITERANFEQCWPTILELLEQEFTVQILGERAVIERSLAADDALLKARELLADKDAMRSAMLKSHKADSY